MDRAFGSAQSLRRHAVVFVQALKDGKLAVAEKALHDIDLLRGLGVRGAQAQELDTTTLRRNFAEIAAELLEAGGSMRSAGARGHAEAWAEKLTPRS